MTNDTHSLSPHQVEGIKSIEKEEKRYYIEYNTGEVAIINVLNDHVIRFYMSPSGKFLDYPKPKNPEDTAKIIAKEITDYGYEAFEKSSVSDDNTSYLIHINNIKVIFDKKTGAMKIQDANKDVLIESNTLSYADHRSTQTLLQRKDEYFFGGGMQNGRFSHKGQTIKIVNSLKWDDGGVSSPCPFYWSSYGYGILRNTWKTGAYDFGFKCNELVITSHEGRDFDAYIFINAKPTRILNDYYELTGTPIIMPEYAFYEAHLNAFNRDYWVQVDSNTPGAILFEDGFYYKSHKPKRNEDNKGILESLNGENNNYQFSARAMIDRYKRHDMPLGWFIPNDGYGCGYGQTDSLNGDIENLKDFAEYSLQNGVQVALWTESNLHPEDPLHPKKGERDLSKEVGVAGIVALKCDVAWIGSGYSFGLSAVEEAANTLVKHTNARPLILMVCGWAGTQRHSGIWSGDQTGGEWEYIRFHIPTYIGTGLSGQPIVGADIDGIYGGGNIEVNIRDYQWKTFTPIQLNMDGWGRIPKTPFSSDEMATSINRSYLKLKSMLMPYNYTLGYESTLGLPMVRAMFLEFPDNEFAYTKECQYQFMWGSDLLVAPVYNEEKIEFGDNESLRHGIYLPNSNQVWIDFFTGQKYQGGKVINNLAVPLWKIPVFVKDGSIIPMTNSNNNPNEIQRDNRIFTIYPNGKTSYMVYEDDGISSQYLEKQYALTKITVVGPPSNERGDLLINVDKTSGSYKNMVKERSTLLQIMVTSDVDQIEMSVNEEFIYLTKAESEEDFINTENVFYTKTDFIINPYFKDIVGNTNIEQKFLLIKISKLDVKSSTINISVKDYANTGVIFGSESKKNTNLEPPCNICIDENQLTSNSVTVQWDVDNSAYYYEIEKNGCCYTNIQGPFYLFDNLKCNTEFCFRIRCVNDDGVSEWSDNVYVTTADDPLKFVVTGITVSCNLPCQPGQEVSNLVDYTAPSIWHTNWDRCGQTNPQNNEFLELSFDLGDIYELDRIEYKPRIDAGNGTFLVVKYKFSTDETEWTELYDVIVFECDNKVKTIPLNGARLRYFKLTILDTVGNYGSGENVLFFLKTE